MNNQLNILLDTLKQNPNNPKSLADLTRVYVMPQLSPEDRALIRMALAGEPELVKALHRWGGAVPETDANRYVRLRLLVHVMTDGRPDSYEAGLAIENLVKWAHRHGIDPGPHIEAVQRVSSAAMATILHQRLLAWSRTRRFVDGQIAVLLETLKQSPSDREAMESLVAMYVHPDTTEEQRRGMRNLVQAKPLLIEHYNKWQPSKKDEDPERFYRLSLGVISLTDARPDWQQAAKRVVELRNFARKNGVDPQEHIDDLCKISSARTEQVLRRQRV